MLFLLTALIFGQSGRPGLKPAAGPARAVTPAPSISDAELERRIQEKFARSKAGGGKFQVKVRNGAATSTGHAEVAQHKGAATRMAKSAGARKIVNQIELSQGARDKASANLAQGRRRAQIKRGDTREGSDSRGSAPR
jgi:hypothetical protein